MAYITIEITLLHMYCVEVDSHELNVVVSVRTLAGLNKELWLAVHSGVVQYAVVNNYNGMTRHINSIGSSVCSVLAAAGCGIMGQVADRPAEHSFLGRYVVEDVEHYNRMLSKGRARELLR